MYSYLFVFFNDTATTEIYTLSLHDALPVLRVDHDPGGFHGGERRERMPEEVGVAGRVQQVYSGVFRFEARDRELEGVLQVLLQRGVVTYGAAALDAAGRGDRPRFCQQRL